MPNINDLADTYVGGDEIDELTIFLMRAWGDADPESDVSEHPISYVSTFASLSAALRSSHLFDEQKALIQEECARKLEAVDPADWAVLGGKSGAVAAGLIRGKYIPPPSQEERVRAAMEKVRERYLAGGVGSLLDEHTVDWLVKSEEWVVRLTLGEIKPPNEDACDD